MSQTSQRELGDSDRPIEDELEDAFARMIDEGTQRLHRTWREVLVTGFFGGTEVAMGVLAYLSVLHATHDPLLAGLAFSIGFLSLLLGRSELFTEGFLVPVTTVAAKRASVSQLLKLWTGTLIANLVGGWLLMWLIMTAFPKLRAQTIESATHYIAAPISAETVALTLLGGMAITLMTRMQHGTDAMVGKIAAAIDSAFGGYDKFRQEFANAGATQFGSGWAWLVSEGGKVAIKKTPNAETPLTTAAKPLLTMDVWEHAYYIDYRNARPKYIDTFLDHLVNWDFANKNLG